MLFEFSYSKLVNSLNSPAFNLLLSGIVLLLSVAYFFEGIVFRMNNIEIWPLKYNTWIGVISSVLLTWQVKRNVCFCSKSRWTYFWEKLENIVGLMFIAFRLFYFEITFTLAKKSDPGAFEWYQSILWNSMLEKVLNVQL